MPRSADPNRLCAPQLPHRNRLTAKDSCQRTARSSRIVRTTSGGRGRDPVSRSPTRRRRQMASGGSGGSGVGEAIGSALALIIYVVFSLTFPILFLTLCGVSYVLAYVFHLPEFVLWAALASLA